MHIKREGEKRKKLWSVRDFLAHCRGGDCCWRVAGFKKPIWVSIESLPDEPSN